MKPDRLLPLVLACSAVACGGSAPPPKTDDTPKEEPRRRGNNAGGPTMSQELGSIDQRAVEQTFDRLQNKLESCHRQGRQRVEYLAGDVKVFLRIGGDGRVKYGYFEESTLGARDTEKCILETFRATDWPKPIGGEAEVRNGFGWPGGSERAPTTWGPEKVTGALEEAKDVKRSVDKCKAGASGDYKVTAYVEPGEIEEEEPPPAAAPAKGAGKGSAGKKDAKAEKKTAREHGGKFKTIGVTPPGKDGADKVDCIADALQKLSLPSPGSYAAKVSFSL
jgi:hypothetical protein